MSIRTELALTRIEDDGYNAYHEDTDCLESDCPYSDDTEHAKAWLRGWHTADAEAMDS